MRQATDTEREQVHEEKPKSLYDIAQEVLLYADIETIFDFDTFCSEVLHRADEPLQQRPSLYMHLGL